jgi:hypothetical protein
VVIVAVNTGTSAVNQKFNVQGGTVAQFSTTQTASGKNMVAGSAVQVSGGSFTASLPGQSITTFAGSTTPTSIQAKPGSPRLSFALRGGVPWVGIPSGEGATLRVAFLDGRVVETRSIPMGASEVALETRRRGLYLVDVAQGTTSQSITIAIP